MDPDLPVYRVMTLADSFARARWPYRVFGGLFAIFALIALALSAIGIYAVAAYAVTQRRQEIGLRMALGAEGSHIAWLVLRRAAVQVAAGLSLGFVLGLALSRVLRSLLVESTADDPLTFLTVVGVFVAVTIAASLIPAYRAARLDPLVVLRAE